MKTNIKGKKCICGISFLPTSPKNKYCVRCQGSWSRILKFRGRHKCKNCGRSFKLSFKHRAKDRCSACYQQHLKGREEIIKVKKILRTGVFKAKSIKEIKQLIKNVFNYE